MANEHKWYKDEETGQYVHDASVLVNAPVDSCFSFWANFESFPRLMRYITEVKRIGENEWHWEANVAGRHVEWNAAMSEFIANQVIVWKSMRGLRNQGSVHFTPEGMGCRISVHLMYDPPYGPIGDLVAERRVNDEFHDNLVQDLLNFKQAVESGQVERFRPAA